MSEYSQFRAMLAIARGSLRAIFRSPSTVVFSLGFPIIFILVFGSIGDNGFGMNIGLSAASDTLNPVYATLQNIKGMYIYTGIPDVSLNEKLKSDSITAIVDIKKQTNGSFYINLKSADIVKPQELQILQAILNSTVIRNDTSYHKVQINPNIQLIKGREFREIDRILPGMLGFSLLGTGVFSVAFLFFNLRNGLVLKRFFATPVKKSTIIFGEGISRISFQLLAVVIIMLFGYLFFGFTFINGVSTFIDMFLLSFLACVIFMGFGFVVSSIASTDSVIPVYSNIFVFPQFLLSGTFFSTAVFPTWLQTICNYLPLTCFNNAMHKISYEGLGLLSTGREVGILLIWGIVVYAVAVKVFKWE